MSEEKKTAVTEEVKEEVSKLTEEELEKVNGGGLPTHAYVVATRLSKVKDIDS